MNKIILTGRLVADPTDMMATTGIKICSFKLAVRKQRPDQKGNITADFFSVTAFGKSAEYAMHYARKGTMVEVVGRMESKKYTAKDGGERWAWDVLVEQINVLSKETAGEGQTADTPSFDAEKGKTMTSADIKAIEEDDLPF